MKAFAWAAGLSLATLLSCSSENGSRITALRDWFFRSDAEEVGVREEWFGTSFDRAGWEEIIVPERWNHQERIRNKEIGWFATSVEVQEKKEKVALFFGRVEDDMDVWVNGVKVGFQRGYGEEISIDVTGALGPGKNQIVLRINGHGSPGGIASVRLGPFFQMKNLIESSYARADARRSEEWVRDGVIYAVSLRSFSKDGSLKALEARIPELESMGVTIVWLMPIHPVGELNRKGSLGSPYSVQDYYAVNPEFGSLDDVRSLVGTAHQHGLRVIMDLVANHSAWDSRLMFEHPEWFTTDETGAIVAPNSDWGDVADLNYGHHELRKYMIGMMEYWVREIGVDGFRCDAAELVPLDFWETARRELESIRPVMMLSESTLPEHHLSAFDMTYAWSTYDVLDKILRGTTPAAILGSIIESESRQFPRNSLRLRFNSNHDENGWDAPVAEKFGIEGTKATAVLMFTLPGVPLIHNGDEVANRKRLSLFEKADIEWGRKSTLRSFYQSLCELRAGQIALRRGSYNQIDSGEEKVLAFLREYGEDRILVTINFSEGKKNLDLDVGGKNKWKEYFGGREVNAPSGKIRLTLDGLQAKVCIPQRKDLP